MRIANIRRGKKDKEAEPEVLEAIEQRKPPKRKWLARGAAVMSCIVVFATTYALIIPAISAEKEALSGPGEAVAEAEVTEGSETGDVKVGDILEIREGPVENGENGSDDLESGDSSEASLLLVAQKEAENGENAGTETGEADLVNDSAEKGENDETHLGIVVETGVDDSDATVVLVAEQTEESGVQVNPVSVEEETVTVVDADTAETHPDLETEVHEILDSVQEEGILEPETLENLKEQVETNLEDITAPEAGAANDPRAEADAADLTVPEEQPNQTGENSSEEEPAAADLSNEEAEEPGEVPGEEGILPMVEELVQEAVEDVLLEEGEEPEAELPHGVDPKNEDVTWALVPNEEEDGYTLAFSGTGAISQNFFDTIKNDLGEYRNSITKLTFSAGITEMGANAFKGTYGAPSLPELKNITFEEGSQFTKMGSSAFQYVSQNLKSADFSNTQLSELSSYSFNACSGLMSLQLPDTVTSIQSYALYGCSSLTDFDLPRNLKTVGAYCFREVPVTSLTVPGSVTTLSFNAFYSMPKLASIVFEENENLTKLPKEVFNFDKALRIIDLSGLKSLTTLDDTIFQTNNGSLLTAPVEMIIGAEALTSVNGNTFNRYSNLAGETITLRIKNTVQSVSETLFTAAGNRLIAYFDPEMDFTITKGAATSVVAMNPFSNLPGNYTVDENGVVYRLHDDHTATLFYCPPGVSSYCVPETITSKKGDTYSVTEVGGCAFRRAEDLTALTFEDPARISLLADSLRYSNLKTVQGETLITPNQYAFVSQLNGFPIQTGKEGLVDSVTVNYQDEENKDRVFVMQSQNPESSRLTDGVYRYLTGETGTVWFSVNNERNAAMENLVIRIYLAFDDDGHQLGTYEAGKDYMVVNTSAGTGEDEQIREYPMKVVRTKSDGIYYYELTGLQPGDVMAFSNGYMYDTIKSNGGNMKIWAEVMTKEAAEATKGEVHKPQSYLQMNWRTKPNDFSLTKAADSTNSWKFVADGTENGKIYASGLQWKMKFTSGTDGSTTNGKDYVTSCDYVDRIELPEELHWDADVLEAIQQGHYRVETNSRKTNGYAIYYVTVNGVEKELFRAGNYYYLNGASCMM